MAQPQTTTKPESATRNPTRDETRRASSTPGHRPVQGPTGAREQHDDNDDPMLLDPDFGGDVSVYSPTESATNLRAVRDVALEAATPAREEGPSFTLPNVDREAREALAVEGKRGLVSAGGGHSHGQEAQVGAKLDALKKQAPEQRKGSHQPRGDMPRGK